jgi:adenylate kinase family enzyme
MEVGMKHQILFIEGLPGSGKTTYARKLKAYYESKGIKVIQYSEGDLHPISLAWCTYTDKETYEAIIKKYPLFKDEIIKHTRIEDDVYMIAYTKIRHEKITNAFYDDLKRYEIYREDNLETFKKAYQKKYTYFLNHHDEHVIYIFECVFLQNHINELILNQNMNPKEIIAYFTQLMKPLIDMNPMMFYIYQDHIEQTLDRIIEERRTDDPSKYRDWIDEVVLYLERTKFAKELGFLGKEGMLVYEEYRQHIEQEIMKSIKIDYHVFHLDHDYDKVFEKMKSLNI